MSNKYKQIFLENTFTNELSNICYKQNEYYNTINGYGNYPDKLVKKEVLMDFFKFYLEDAGFTASEMIGTPRLSSQMVSILFGREMENNIDQIELISYFEKELRTNINFYKESLIYVLNHHLHDNLNKSDKSQYMIEVIEQNEIIFNALIDLGIEESHFNKLQPEDIHTRINKYREILKEKNIFNDEYNIEKFRSLFHVKQSDDKIKLNPIDLYISTYVKEIMEDLSDENRFNDFIESLEGKSKFLISQLLEYKHPDKELYSDFLLKVFKNKYVEKQIFDRGEKYLNPLIRNYSNLLLPFINTLSPENTRVFMKGDLIKPNYFYMSQIVPSYWMDKVINNKDEIKDEPLTKFLSYCSLKIKEQQPVAVEHIKVVDEYLSKSIIEYVINYRKKLPHKELPESEKNALKDLIVNNIDSITAGYTINKKNANINLLEKFNCLDNKDYNFVINKLSEKLGKDITEMVALLEKKDLYYNPLDRHVEFIDQLPEFMTMFNKMNLISNFYNSANEEKEIVVTIKEMSKNNKVKHKENYPVELYLVEKTNGKAIEWYIQNDKMKLLEEARYKNKGFLNIMVSGPHILEVLKQLSVDSDLFDRLILKNKPIMKQLIASNEPEVKQLLMFNKLQTEIPTKTENVKKNKI